MSADRAIQPLSNPGQVRLEAIEAKVTRAGQGDHEHHRGSRRLRSREEHARLLGAIAVNSAEGYRLRMTDADVDFGAGTMVSDNPVSIGYGDSEITGERLSVSDGGKHHRHRGQCAHRADAAEARRRLRRAPQRVRSRAACEPEFCSLSRLSLALCGAGARRRISARAFAGFDTGSDDPIQIEADQLEVRDAEKLAIYSGNVRVRQGDTILEAPELRVFYAGEADAQTGAAGSVRLEVSRIEAGPGVSVRSGDQTASGDRAVLDMAKDLVTLRATSC